MSLSRILNDEPPPARKSVSSRGGGINPSLADVSLLSSHSPVSSFPNSSSDYKLLSESSHHFLVDILTRRPLIRVPKVGIHIQVTMFRERSFLLAQEPRASSAGAYYKEDENEPISRKRRKAVVPDDDSDYNPPIVKRAPRQNPPRAKANCPKSPLIEGADPVPAAREYHQTEEERRLASSDLSDCE
ncbi:hypothetical protein CY34DRAFT_19628, partial [Suillus luteus UH-Slu-Lm8-n1]